MPQIFELALYLCVCFSLTGSVLVVIDKYNAVHKLFRISEATLMFFGVFGGAFLMFFTMKICRHKTRKPKFMLTFPFLAALHIVLLLLAYQYRA